MTKHLRFAIHGVCENCGHLEKFNPMLRIKSIQTIISSQCYYRKKDQISLLLAGKVKV